MIVSYGFVWATIPNIFKNKLSLRCFQAIFEPVKLSRAIKNLLLKSLIDLNLLKIKNFETWFDTK